ncbi:MAG: acyloxyacyl hydrolase [Rhodospirillaceae bacterium]|nr:MAG: acyloxyacyl hydrolase [Rhodospirillaceae bacterium]
MRTSLAALVGAAACAIAAMTSSARADDASQLTVGAGLFDLVSHHAHPAEADVTYRFGWGLFGGDGVFRGLKPVVGVMGNTKGGVMGWAGLAAPFQFDNDRWEIEPSAGLGGYRRGSGIDLGGTFEFHLGLGASYAISDHSRLGVEFTHISNANTHRINPGSNSALVTWSWMFGD